MPRNSTSSAADFLPHHVWKDPMAQGLDSSPLVTPDLARNSLRMTRVVSRPWGRSVIWMIYSKVLFTGGMSTARPTYAPNNIFFERKARGCETQRLKQSNQSICPSLRNHYMHLFPDLVLNMGTSPPAGIVREDEGEKFDGFIVSGGYSEVYRVSHSVSCDRLITADSQRKNINFHWQNVFLRFLR
jgi:hypothetical protein